MTIVMKKPTRARASPTLGILLTGGTLYPARSVAAALVLGSLAYEVSTVLDAYALRLVGTAREERSLRPLRSWGQSQPW